MGRGYRDISASVGSSYKMVILSMMPLDWFKGNLPENPTFHCIKHGFRLSKVFPRNHIQWLFVWDNNPPACRRVLWILLVRSCSVRFVSLSRLSLGADLFPLPPAFRLHLSLRNGGPNSAHASLNTGLALHMLLSFRWLFPFFCCVCHRVAPSLLISNTWSTGFCAEHLLHA